MNKKEKDFILILCLSIIWHWGYAGENASKRNVTRLPFIQKKKQQFLSLNETIEFCVHVKSTCDSILNDIFTKK